MSVLSNIEDTIMQPQHPDTVLRLSNIVETDSLPHYLSKDSIAAKDSLHKSQDTIPQYYRSTFFSADSMWHTEIKGGEYGVAGDPMEYSMRGDTTFNLLLLISFVVAIVSVSKSRRFVVRQVKDYFYTSRSEHSSLGETSSEIWFQGFLAIVTCLQVAILFYSYTIHFIGDTFVLDSQYQLIAIYFALSLSYLMARLLVCSIVNTTFFGWKKNLQWTRVLLFLTAFEGVLLFPVVLLLVYFGLSMDNVVICSLSILIIVKLLTFYKYYTIFFRHTSFFLQIILYFCALEIVPLAFLWGAMVRIANEMIIIF